MADQTLTIEELKGQPIEKILQKVVDQQKTLIVRFPDGKEVMIEPKPPLKPLPELEGRVPERWKDAVYSPIPTHGIKGLEGGSRDAVCDLQER